MTPTDAPIVLVVEDDSVMRGLLTDALQEAGYGVVAAQDGTEAVDAIAQHRPPGPPLCVVLLDLMMPYVDGIELLFRLKERGADVPVVAMSGSPLLLRAARRAGAQGTLEKPFTIEKLLATVARHCAGSRRD